MRIAVLVVTLLACACQRGQEGPPPDVVADIERLCNAEKLSGADDPGQTTARGYVIANYLADNLETQAVVDLLGDFAKTPESEKEAFLRKYAAWAGLKKCPLADTWAAHTAEKSASEPSP